MHGTNEEVRQIVGRATCLLHDQLWVCEWEGPHMYSVHTHTCVELVAAESSANVIQPTHPIPLIVYNFTFEGGGGVPT